MLVILSQGVAVISLKEAIATELKETSKCSHLFISKTLREEISRLVKDSNFINKYEGQEGYLSLAQELNIEMMYLYQEVSSHLTKNEMRRFNWQRFQGKAEAFNSLRETILDKDGNIKPEFTGDEGYRKVAILYFDGDMLKTFTNVSAVLSKEQMRRLNWQQFQGKAEAFNSLREAILDAGNIKPEFTDPNGYLKFAILYFDGDMQKTFTNVSAVLSKEQMRRLNWQQFQGKAEAFNSLREAILDAGNIKPEFTDPNGYLKFAILHFDGDMQKTFTNVSAVLSKEQMRQLNWQQFQGKAEALNSLREAILDKDGNIKPEFTDPVGYLKVAIHHFDGDMQKTFVNVSAVLGGAATMKEMGFSWKQFQGSASEYKQLIELAKNTDRSKWQGRDGQKYVADKIFKGNTKRTYQNVSSLREELLGSWKAFKVLNWDRK